MTLPKKYLLLFFILTGLIQTGSGSVTVTPANSGNCLNVSPGAYLPIGNIVITENLAGDFSTQVNTTLILSAPTGFTFQFGSGTLVYTPARNITAATISTTLTTITVTLTVTGTGLIDQLSICNVNARATGTGLTGTILRKPPSGGTASITGDAVGGGIIHGNLSSIGGGATFTTAAAGNWNTPATWVGGIVPLCGDNVVINHSLTANIATMVNNASINSGGNLIATNPITVNGTFTIAANGTYTHDNTGNVSVTIFKGTESFATASNIIINNWYNAAVPLAMYVTGNFGNVTLDYNAVWDQDGMFAPNKIKGTLTVTDGQVVMDDGTGATTSITLQDVLINTTGSIIFAKGTNRNLTLTTNNFTDNSASSSLTALMYDTYGTLTWNCNGNLTLAHDFSGIEGTAGVHAATAGITITGNLTVNSGKIDFVKYITGSLNLSVTGSTSIVSNFGNWCHLADFNSANVTYSTTNLTVSGNIIGNYFQGSAGTSTFTILNDFTYNGTGMFSFTNLSTNFSAQVINVSRDFRVTSGNVGFAYSGGVIFTNIMRDFILTGATTMVTGQFNPASTANTNISIGRNCSLTSGEFNASWGIGQLFFTTNGTLSCSNAIFEGAYVPLAGNYGTATFTIDSLDFDGGELHLFDSYITDGRTVTANFGNLVDLNFLSANDKVFFITNSTNANNPLLALSITGNLNTSGNSSGTFVSSRSAGNETCIIGGSVTINGGTNSFVGSTILSSQPHNITTTITGNLNVTNGSLYLSTLNGTATITVNGNTAVSGGNLFLKHNNGPAVMNMAGSFTQTNGNFIIHNNTTLTNIADTVKANGAFSQTGGIFCFDNAPGTAGLATHVLVINGSSYTAGGTGTIRHMNHLTANTVFGQIIFNRNGTITYNRSTATHDIQQVKQIISPSCTVNASASLNPFLVSSHQDNTASVHNTLNVNGVLQTGTTQIYARQQANYYSQLTVNTNGKISTANTGGFYKGSAAVACVYGLISGNNRMNYFLDASSTIEYNGVDNQEVTGVPNGIANTTQHKYGKLEINFTGTANTEFVYPESDSEVFARTQLILTAGELNLDNNHLTPNGGRSITIENAATITRNTGYLRSEVEDGTGLLRWNITANGNYIVPFGLNNTNYIPFTYTQNSGSTGWIKFATYGTPAANNLPLPPTVTHVNGTSGANNSSNTVNRFWYINTVSNPNFSLTFSATATELSGVIAARAQRWLPVPKAWEPKKGTQSNPTATTTLVASTTGMNSWWALAGNSNPLPVELLSFSPTCEKEKVIIKWTTASQLNNDYFEIEKSIDSKNWQVITKVKGEGTTHEITNYEITDALQSGNITYYRISQTDYNGEKTLLQTAAVKNCSANDLSILDYTFSENNLSLTVNFEKQEPVEITLMDCNAKIVARKMQNAGAGINTVELNYTHISNGIYLIKIHNELKQLNKKIIKL